MEITKRKNNISRQFYLTEILVSVVLATVSYYFGKEFSNDFLTFSILGSLSLSLTNAVFGFWVVNLVAKENYKTFTYAFFLGLLVRMQIIILITVLLIRFNVVHCNAFYLSLMGFSIVHQTLEIIYIFKIIKVTEEK